MKKEDIRIGMKVVPHSKSVWLDDDETFEDYVSDSFNCTSSFFKDNKYLKVVDWDKDIEAFVLGDYKGVDGDFFLAEDFEPYNEEGASNEDKLNLLSETFSKIFNEPIEFIERTVDVAKDLVDNAFPSQKRLNRAESFYNALISTLIVMKTEVQACGDILPHLDGYNEVELEEEIATLQESINWTMDAFALAIADCLDIDFNRDDYFNIFYDAITKKYGFEWMIEKLKKEEVI